MLVADVFSILVFKGSTNRATRNVDSDLPLQHPPFLDGPRLDVPWTHTCFGFPATVSEIVRSMRVTIFCCWI